MCCAVNVAETASSKRYSAVTWRFWFTRTTLLQKKGLLDATLHAPLLKFNEKQLKLITNKPQIRLGGWDLKRHLLRMYKFLKRVIRQQKHAHEYA